MSAITASDLERQATRERERLQNTVSHLADRVRDTVDPKQIVRTHLLSTLVVCGIAALALGYLIAIPFTLSRRP